MPRTGPQQVVDVQDADRPARRIDDEQAVIGRARAFIVCSASSASASGPIVRGEGVMMSATRRASRSGPICAAQIAVGDDAGQPAVRIGDPQAAEALFGHQQQGVVHRHVRRAERHGVAGVHQVAHPPEPGAEPAARDGSGGNRPR